MTTYGIFTFSAEPGTYTLKLVEGSSLSGLKSGKYSLRSLLLVIPIIILGDGEIIDGFV